MKKDKRLFASMAFHYQALRTLGHVRGANAGECLAAMRTIRDGDAESWHRSWYGMGERCEAWAESSGDTVSRGQACLRASNYYRSSEFFLHPADKRKRATYDKSASMFQKGIAALGIEHEIWRIPYEGAFLRAYFFPGDADKPLILACGGFDSTNEESFFWIGLAAVERGYPCIMFEGPGQSNMIRQYGIAFTPAWERPVKAILDYAEESRSELRAAVKILFGISFGGRLAPRAAALEKRIDGLVIFGGAFYDAQQAPLRQVPPVARLIFKLKMKKLFNLLAGLKARLDIGRRWAISNGCWTMETDNAYDLVERFRSYSLDEYAADIDSDVLILHGEGEHFYNEHDMAPFRERLVNARSVTIHVFNKTEGAGAHCQAGALEQMEMVFFNWLITCGFKKMDDKKEAPHAG